MGKKLYVGNLNYATTEGDLQKLFAEVGSVASATVITDKMTGRSKGFGFVEMETEEDAQTAIQRFNEYEFNQRKLTVNEARPPKERSFGGGGGGDRRRSGGGGDRRGGGGSGDRRGGGDRDRDRRRY